MRLIFPNSQRINRGNYEIKQLVEACRANEVTDLILLHEHRGVPGTVGYDSLEWGSPVHLTSLEMSKVSSETAIFVSPAKHSDT